MSAGAGFELVDWVDETAWVSSWFDAVFSASAVSTPSLPMLLEDGFTRTINFAGALADGTLGVRRGAFTRSAG